MKKTFLLKTMLLLCALVAGSSNVWADTKTEDFEKQSAGTTYNSTQSYTAANSNCGIAWTMYYGTVSTNDKISGTKSAQMRWYSSATSNIPYAKTTTAIDGLSNVALKAKTSSTDVKMDVCYSADGSTWTVGKTHTFTATGTGEDVSLAIPSGNKYVKFEVSSSSTAPSSGNYKLIIDDVVFTYSSDLEDATWTLDPASATVLAGESTTLGLSTNYDGTLTFTSDDTDVATVSYNASTKVITVTGVAAGTTTIVVTGDATATYNAISKSIDVTVNHSELANNYSGTISSFGYSYFGLTPSGSNTYVENENTSKTDAIGVTLAFAKAESSNKPRFDASYMRFYNKNTLTVTAPTGSYITKIVFTEPSKDKSWSGSMTTNSVGDYVSSGKTWYATETGTTSVVFTNDNTKRIGGMVVYLYRTTVPVAITTAEYATFSTANALDFSETGITVYTATDNETSVTLNEVASGKVPANTPVVLYKAGADGTPISVPVIASADAIGGTNDLRVSTGTDVENMYVLAKKPTIGFYPWNGTTDLSAGKIYLQGKASYGAREFLGFGNDSETTGIDKVQVSGFKIQDSEVYNLNGQRVMNPTKGLYIVNGRKVVVK